MRSGELAHDLSGPPVCSYPLLLLSRDLFAAEAAKYLKLRPVTNAGQLSDKSHGHTAVFAGGSFDRTGGAVHVRKVSSRISKAISRQLLTATGRNCAPD
jgi:hypothetical protein